jgi:hypothetical protein
MNFFESLRAQIVLSDPTLANLVFAAMPQVGGSTYPTKFVVYLIAGGDRFNTLDGVVAPGSTVTCRKRVQIGVYSDSGPAAYTTFLTLMADLHGFRGVMGGVGGSFVHHCLPISGQERSGFLEGPRRHFYIQDYDFMHDEVLP